MIAEALKQSGRRSSPYLDQQRKFGDDVFASTNGRTPEQIAKPFRDKAHGFIRLKNGYLQKFGPFKGRGRFEWKEFVEEPRKTSEPIGQGAFELSPIADCYRTQDGVGVKGHGADKGQRAKGIPVMMVIPGALVLALACVFVPYALGKGASWYISGGKSAPAEVVSTSSDLVTTGANAVGGIIAPPARGSSEDSRVVPAPLEPIYVDDRPERPLWVSGWLIRGHKVNVQLSDGRVLTEKDPEVAKIERNALHLSGGQRLFLRPAEARSGSVVEAVPPAPAAPGVVGPDGVERPAAAVAASAWRLDSDGVQRLVGPSVIGKP